MIYNRLKKKYKPKEQNKPKHPPKKTDSRNVLTLAN